MDYTYVALLLMETMTPTLYKFPHFCKDLVYVFN